MQTLMQHIRRGDIINRNIQKRELHDAEREEQRNRKRDSFWLINNACFIQNQLGPSTQNMFCIMKSLASTLVRRSTLRPTQKPPANYRPAEPSHNMKRAGSGLHGAAHSEGFSEASLAGHENARNQTKADSHLVSAV